MYSSRPMNLVLFTVAIVSLVFSQVAVIRVWAAQDTQPQQQTAAATPDDAKKEETSKPAKKKKKKKSARTIVPYVLPPIPQQPVFAAELPIQKSDRTRIGSMQPVTRHEKGGSIASTATRVAPPPVSPVFGQSTAFSNPAAITINASGAATPYPVSVNVSGLTGTITNVSVTINNFSHTFVRDVGMVLVAPTGRAFNIQDGAGDLGSMSNVTYTISDAGAAQLPEDGAWAAGTYRPANYVNDDYPAPGPGAVYGNPGPIAGGSETFASVFNGFAPNGTWNLFVFDFVGGDSGSIAGGITLHITTTGSAAGLMISEFRLRGPNGANDEFIEIYNGSGSDHTVDAAVTDGTGDGYGIAASDGVTRCVIPNGTVIPNKGHYLCVNSVGYSLAAHPAGNGTTATGDATYTADILDNAGIALFNNSVGEETQLQTDWMQLAPRR